MRANAIIFIALITPFSMAAAIMPRETASSRDCYSACERKYVCDTGSLWTKAKCRAKGAACAAKCYVP
ncbi:hypothetical protein LTR17_009248 [Elasticomyces elasticus]|nr:hypothetical protein LTR17_009248 [Elasticomyces elasticus]